MNINSLLLLINQVIELSGALNQASYKQVLVGIVDRAADKLDAF